MSNPLALFLFCFPLFLLRGQHTFVLTKKTDFSSGRDEGNTRLGQKQTQLQTEIMVCIGGTCSASSFSSCLLFHLTAKIKAYNQIPLIGPEDGDHPTGSPLTLSVVPRLAHPHSAENDNESQAAGAPVSQDSGLLQLTLPADSQLVVIFAVYCRPDLAISSVPPHPLLSPIDHPELLMASFLTPPFSCSLFATFLILRLFSFSSTFSLFVFVSNLSCSSCV